MLVQENRPRFSMTSRFSLVIVHAVGMALALDVQLALARVAVPQLVEVDLHPVDLDPRELGIARAAPAAALSSARRTSICEFTLAVVEESGMDVTLSIISTMPGREADCEMPVAASARALMTITASFLILPAFRASRMVLLSVRPELGPAMMGAA